MSRPLPGADYRGFYAALGIELPGWAHTEAPVRCFADPDAHAHGDRDASCPVNLHSDSAVSRSGQALRSDAELLARVGRRRRLEAHGMAAGSRTTGVSQDRNSSTRIAGRTADGAERRGGISRMGRLDKITYNGQRAAVVVGEEGIVSDGLGEDDERTVKAMCLYAREARGGAGSGQPAGPGGGGPAGSGGNGGGSGPSQGGGRGDGGSISPPWPQPGGGGAGTAGDGGTPAPRPRSGGGEPPSPGGKSGRGGTPGGEPSGPGGGAETAGA